MSIQDIFNEDKTREEKVSSIREMIRSSIDESAKAALEEKFGKKDDKDDKDDKDGDNEDDGDGDGDGKKDDKDGDDEDEESDRRGVNESLQVTAMPIGRSNRPEEIKVNRLSDVNKLARSRKYDYFSVKKRNGETTEYTVDPQGNLVEM